MCFLCLDKYAKAHVNCNTCGKGYHLQCLYSRHENECPICKVSWKPSNEYIKLNDLLLLLKKREMLTALKISIDKTRMNFDAGQYWCTENKRIEYFNPSEPLTEYQTKLRRCLDGNLQILEMEIFMNNVCYKIIDKKNK